MVLLQPQHLDQDLEDLTRQVEEREGTAAARLRTGLQRVAVLSSLAKEAEEKMENLEPQDGRLTTGVRKTLILLLVF